ncbi:hypothetical protein BGX38DRAFT_1083968 [Terfezia claveryi]|nr:hypothetical protein BGX38DRAFT_1083968 [Terfezia claveryi]
MPTSELWHLLYTNSTHVSFDGITTFNESLLNEFNYTIYSNGTLSNSSKCVLAFDIYKPVMLYNGTILNGTKCDSPVDPIETRGVLGIVSAVLFAVLIMWGLVNLKKHGQSHLPVEKEFRLVSRRWPWYWAIFTASVGCVSGFMAIDADRDYLPGTAIILQCVFYYVSLPTVLAAAWEMTRHWGSFEERKILDEDPYALKQDDRRSKIEFYIPLVFYLFGFLTFFLSVLRAWTPITKQHIYTHTAADERFQASSIFAVFASLTILASAFVSSHYYRTPIPYKIPIVLSFLIARIAYGIACAFDQWEINLVNIHANPGWVYGLGYVPMVGVLLTMCATGWKEENEDLVLIRRRREREVREEMEVKGRMKGEMHGGGDFQDPKKELEKAIEEKERLAREDVYRIMA